MTVEPKTEAGACPKCGRWLDDHNGWLTRDGPYCPPPKKGVIHEKGK